MSEKFDVFDEWGRKVGEFIPVSAESGLIGCLVYITLFVLLIIVSIPILLLVKGVQYWRENKKDQAVFCFVGVLLIVAIPFLIYANNIAQEDAWLREREQAQIDYQKQVWETTAKLPETVVISNVRIEDKGDAFHLFFTVTNNGPMKIYVTVNMGAQVKHYFTGGELETNWMDVYGDRCDGINSIHPGSSGECKVLWVEKKEGKLERFCIPVSVTRFSDEGRYICKELTTP